SRAPGIDRPSRFCAISGRSPRATTRKISPSRSPAVPCWRNYVAKAKPISLLKELGGGYEASIVTTYAAHLPFYEHVVLGGLTAAGCRQNMLVADAGECVKALSDISTRPEDAG